MGYLQLADDGYSHLAELSREDLDKYIFIPEGFKGSQKDMWIREDAFDNLDPDDRAETLRALAPYQQQGLSKGRGKEKREERYQLRMKKKAGRGAGARREARQQRIQTRQEQKTARKAQGGGGEWLDKVGGIVGGIFGKGQDQGGGDRSLDLQTDNLDLQVSGGNESFFSKYKWPIIIGGVAITGGIIFAVTRKGKRK